MSQYRKKPVVIKAEQFFEDEYHTTGRLPAGCCDCVKSDGVHIHTLEGVMLVGHEDWVITGVVGERYPCKDSIFQATYEAVDTGETP
jgi:hypothetical protein